MKRIDSIARFINGELSEEEQARFQRDIAADPELRDEVVQYDQFVRTARQVVDSQAEQRLDPFFADRLMKVISGNATRVSRQEEFANGLLRWFSPVAVTSLAVIVLLVFGSLTGSDRDSSSVTDSVLGLPAVTIANVYDLDYE